MRFLFTPRTLFLTKFSLALACLHPIGSVAQTESPRPSSSPSLVPEEAPTLEEVVVTGQSGGGEGPAYAAQESRTATKTRTLLLETPQAVSVVTRKLIEDEGVQDLEGALRNVAGVSVGGYYNEWDYYRIRGFDASNTNTYLDGLLADGAPYEEIWGLERIEVIKGPASTLFGQGPLGGFVNLVSKRPRPDFFGEVQFTAGSFDYYQGAFDVNVPLNKNRTIYARLNALFRSAGSFVDFAESKRVFVAPAFTWEIGPATSLTLLTSYRDDWMNFAFPLPARGTVLPNPNGEIPISRYIGNPAHPNDEWERIIRVGYEFDHRFNESIGLIQNFRYFWLDWTSNNLSYPQSLSEDGRFLTLQGYRATGNYYGWRIDTASDFAFGTGPFDHLVLLGVDYRSTTQEFTSQDANTIELDVFTPNYDALPPYVYGPKMSSKETYGDLGIYLQDQVKLLKNVTLTAGIRYDYSYFDIPLAFGTDESGGYFSEYAFSPRVGITYEFFPGAAAYFNWSRSFNPQWFSTDVAGKPVAPETGENFEVGLKWSLFNNRLVGLMSLYQLTRNNVATPDLATPDPFDSIVTGQQRARGFELELAANPIPGFEIVLAYTFIDAEVTQDNTIPIGTPLQGVPANSFSAWVKYTIQEGPLQGLGLGLGGVYYSSQSGDIDNTFDLPAYGVMDTAIYYKRGRYRAQVNFNNVLDSRYFVGSYDEVYVLPGAPFNVLASFTVEF